MKWALSFFFLGILFFLSSLTSWHISAVASSSDTVSTTITTVAATTVLTQSDYRWYQNTDALTPVTALASENTATSTPSSGTVLRLRMNIHDSLVALSAGATFNLQFAENGTSSWTTLTPSTAWKFSDNASVADGQIIVTTVLTNSDVGESYSESNPTASSPNDISTGQKGEWDWVIQSNSADTESNWFFRMIYSSGTALDAYDNYPKLTAAEAAAPPSPPSPPATISGGISIIVEPPLVKRPPIEILNICDFNGDNACNIIDLSIQLFYYGEEGSEISRYDLNGSNRVDFPDISILLFYWTG